MVWYLRRFFTPACDGRPSGPRGLAHGRADKRNLRELGYVRNVLPGQALAELEPLESPESLDAARTGEAGFDPRFLLDEPVLPAGENTLPAPDNPLRLTAGAAGYAVYDEQGRIAVRTMLTVDGDVDFHTGNISFVGDVHIRHDIRKGFAVRGENVRVDGVINTGRVRAGRDLTLAGGARGDCRAPCLLAAGRDMRAGFADRAELRARRDLDVEQALHSVLLAGNELLVRGRLSGGLCRVRSKAVVRGDVGTAAMTPTQIQIGLEPFLAGPLHRCGENLARVRRVMAQCAPLADHLPRDANDCARRLDRARREERVLQRQHARLRAELNRAAEGRPAASLLVGGTVHPGVSISVDGAELLVDRPLSRVRFERRGDAVAILPLELAL